MQFDERSVPDWLCICEDDFDSVLGFACEFVQAAVTRYRGKVNLWQCAGRINTGTALSLSDDERMKLTARAIELTRSLDPKADVVVSFDQPWAEYLGRQKKSYPPIQFADMLIRSGLGLTGLALEINVGYYPGGTLPRDAVDFGRQLDYWSLLGLPLYLTITVPSDWQPECRRGRYCRVGRARVGGALRLRTRHRVRVPTSVPPDAARRGRAMHRRPTAQRS